MANSTRRKKLEKFGPRAFLLLIQRYASKKEGGKTNATEICCDIDRNQ
jgi:hypothetical protein